MKPEPLAARISLSAVNDAIAHTGARVSAAPLTAERFLRSGQPRRSKVKTGWLVEQRLHVLCRAWQPCCDIRKSHDERDQQDLCYYEGQDALVNIGKSDLLGHPLMMNTFMPTGGVISPSSTTMTTIIPNQTGSMPNCCITGKKIGIVSRIIAKESKRTPLPNKLKDDEQDCRAGESETANPVTHGVRHRTKNEKIIE